MTIAQRAFNALRVLVPSISKRVNTGADSQPAVLLAECARCLIDVNGNVIIAADFLTPFTTTGAATIITAGAFTATMTFTATTGVTFPTSGTLATRAGTESLSSKTLVSPVISTGLTASGSASNDFSTSTGTFKTSSGLTSITGGLVGVTEALSGAGAVGVTTVTTKLTTTGASQALTLANGTDGQIKTILHDVDGGSAILTPTTKTGFTTITFTAVGETATLQYATTRGWFILALNGAVAS